MLFSTFTSVSTLLLHVLVASASIQFVAAQTNINITTDELYGKLTSTAAPAPGFNAEGGSVFGNFVYAVNERQFFLLITGNAVYEKPESEPVRGSLFYWCSDLTFSDFSNTSLMGYAGRCVDMFLAGYADITAAGAQSTYEYSEGNFGGTLGVSAVFVEQQNIFEGQYHRTTDDWVYRYWDDGRKRMPMILWEGHDEGDMSPNAATASWSAFTEGTWISVEEIAQLFNASTDEFTPETFKQVYEDTWIKGNEKEAITNNPNSQAELETIEQVVKNETDSDSETLSAAEPGTDEEDGTDASTPIEDDSAGNGRKLTSVAARFVSAALRIFCI